MSAYLAPPPQLVWFRGQDAIKFLNDLISQEIGTLKSGSVTRSLLLDAQGRVDFVLWVLVGDGEVGLSTEDGRGDALATTLGRYKIRVDVEVIPETRDVLLVAGDMTVPARSWIEKDGGLTADLSWAQLPRQLVVGGNRPDLAMIDPEQYARLRINAGEPIVGVDLDEKTIPQETGLVAETVSFDKGCFLGQELVARLDSRGGRVNRHLRVIEFDSPVHVGDLLHSGDREVGTLTTVSENLGMAMVWREVGPGDVVTAGDVVGSVSEIPQKSTESFTAS